MAGTLPRLQRGLRSGGSLVLGELLDENGEAIYFDLLEHKQIDLAAFIAGEARGTVKMILHHIRHLPEDATYTAIMSSKIERGDIEIPEPPAEVLAQMDATTWTFDRKLMAQIVNAINLNTRVTGQWKDGQAPDFPTVGPSRWSEGDSPTREEQQISVLDVMKAWGYNHVGS